MPTIRLRFDNAVEDMAVRYGIVTVKAGRL